nr:MAG: hypothetical protein DIU68_13445 [Chloroflexota bacterium]
MAPMQQGMPEGYHTATPYLIVNDADRAVSFYQRAFGATELRRSVDSGGTIRQRSNQGRRLANHARHSRRRQRGSRTTARRFAACQHLPHGGGRRSRLRASRRRRGNAALCTRRPVLWLSRRWDTRSVRNHVVDRNTAVRR